MVLSMGTPINRYPNFGKPPCNRHFSFAAGSRSATRHDAADCTQGRLGPQAVQGLGCKGFGCKGVRVQGSGMLVSGIGDV